MEYESLPRMNPRIYLLPSLDTLDAQPKKKGEQKHGVIRETVRTRRGWLICLGMCRGHQE